MAAALTEAVASMEERNSRLLKIREYVIEEVKKLERIHINGDLTHRLAGNINVCFEGIEGESLLLMLDYNGICASSGSACIVKLILNRSSIFLLRS